MGMSRERKVFMAVLLVAGAGLAVDRGFLGVSGAKPVHAAEISVIAPEEQPKAQAATPAAQSFATLAARLKKLGSFPNEADLLAPTLQHVHVVEEPIVKVQEPVREDRRKQFVASHHLSAVTATARGSNALVNGRAVMLGEEIGGYRLVDVTRDGAIFEGAEGRVELRLPSNQ